MPITMNMETLLFIYLFIYLLPQPTWREGSLHSLSVSRLVKANEY